MSWNISIDIIAFESCVYYEVTIRVIIELLMSRCENIENSEINEHKINTA